MLIRTGVPVDTVYGLYENKAAGDTPLQPAMTKHKVMILILAVLVAVIHTHECYWVYIEEI